MQGNLGNAFPHGGAPKLGNMFTSVLVLYRGDVQVADYVVIGANSGIDKRCA